MKMKLYPSLLLVGLISTLSFVASNEVLALKAFKEAVFEDPHLLLSNWNTLVSDPCDWYGVLCTPDRNHVIKINIAASSLGGFLAPELGQMIYLQELVLHDNNLVGTIPKELGMLKYLKVLDLGMNQLSGSIPAEIGNLGQIMKINLNSNGLTGRIPTELGNLKYLRELRLDRNKLQGPIPGGGSFASNMTNVNESNVTSTGLCRLSQLKVADFSYNFISGSIPKCLEYLPRSSFQCNCLQRKDIKQRSSALCAGALASQSHPDVNLTHQSSESNHQGASKPAWLLALEIVTGTMVCAFIVIAIFTAFRRGNNKASIIIPWKKSASEKDHFIVHIDTQLLKDVTMYSRQELEVACEDFSNIIGSSSDSLVYKGTIERGPEIAVISLCIKEEYWTGYLELYFQREVADLARLNHENTGKLLGYCRESNPFTRMLVFDYASNGTLYENLHCYEDRCQLTWRRRMKIIIGIARGLKYLHTEIEPPFTISELNSNAVYLTEDFFPKLVDFENWKTILERLERNSGSIGSQGSVSVLSNTKARHLDTKGNVFAFAVLLLEIISGRPPYCKDKGYLVDWAKDYIEMPEIMSHLVDPELKDFRDDELKVICEVITFCISPDPTVHPSMQEICSMLESRIDTSTSVDFKSSSLAWAELALSS
ncbi:hypothetical protein Lal_00016799 [Lupinus albus]|uniref:Uncharacterized protein n=1 Tax=Lupinus albus TaxID=3870 RepID=A0A6A5MJ54_LUPAL|nr:putative protein kinase RLK-Pelle-LRR-VI-2 family [Lupinus albus]KAF1872498.1 hypothetical protein Lal_00016799 [Lupinus albus]